LNPDGAQRSVGLEESRHPDYSVELEQRECRGGIVQINAAFLEFFDQCIGERIGIHFQPERKRGSRSHTVADAIEACPLNGLVQLDRVAPEGLVAESIEAKRLPSFDEHPLRVIVDLSVESCAHLLVVVIVRHGDLATGKGQD
jgi:hypothetical protein